MKTTLTLLLAAAVTAASGTRVSAGDREWAVAGKVLTGVVAASVVARALDPGPPVYVAPAPCAPVVYAPPPVVYVPPAPVVVCAPAPVYCPPPPVYYAPPVRVYRYPAPVIYRPGVRVEIGWGGHGRGHGHGRW